MIIKRLLDLAAGTVKIGVPDETMTYLIDRLIKSKTGYDIINEEGKTFVRIRSYDLKAVKGYLDGKEYTVGPIKGAPGIFMRYRRRYGVLIGAVIFALIVYLSQRYVWQIDVYGCKTGREEEIIENLASLGFTYGTDIEDTDFDKLHNDYLRKFDDLAWISVNMKGTWAGVEVKDIALPEEKESGAVMNVVASEGGRIISIEPEKGKPMIKIGEFVSKGDLLISGIITVGEDGVRYESSDGRVLAEVRRNFTLCVPKIKEKKTYTGETYTEKSVRFFKKSVKLSGNYRISPYEYDKIYNKERNMLFGSIPLPVFTETTVYREYETEYETVSYEDALLEFERQYPQNLENALGAASLISISYEESQTNDDYVREYELFCISDISERREISIN